jgi:serine/threonine-protein kinase
MAGLRSPHTVTLFDFGVTTDGAFYYAMELLDGLDAGTLVRRFGPLPPERVVHLLRQVCHSLSEAHGRGLVHRDVTPANIFVCRYGEDHDFVKVLDFGLVTAASGTPAAAEVVTLATGIHGTPAYMAPEQGMGKPDVDGRADIYALGCVAYWLLTGQQVFTADTAIAVILEHARTAPVPPSSRAAQPVPEALDTVILACLAKDPAARPQTAGALSARLADAAGTARWSETRARVWWGEHLPAAAAGIESRG